MAGPGRSHDIDIRKTDADVGENYLIGYLTWNAGKGSIAWSAEAATEPAAGSLAPERTSGSAVGTALFQNTGSGEAAVPRLEFESEPVPTTLYVNASRVMQLDLIGRSTNPELFSHCRHSGQRGPVVRADIGERHLGGTLWSSHISNRSQYAAPPASLCSWFYRMYVEEDIIQAGERITLQLIFFNKYPADWGSDDLAFVTSGNFRSVLRIPLYDLKDQLARVPIFGEDRSQQGAKTGSSLPPASAALVVAALGIPGHRTGRRGAWLAPVLLAAALGGCLGGEAPGPSPSALADDAPRGSAESRFVQVNGSTSASTGSLLVVVKDDEEIPVVGAFVVVLATPFFDRTDSLGRVLFVNITPGQYQVRIDHASFVSFETTADVAAGQLTRLTVSLAPSVPRAMLPHRHDYWNGATERVWFEREILPEDSCKKIYYVTGGDGCDYHFTLPPPKTDGSSIVLPGTYDVEVEVTWDPAATNIPWASVGFIGNDDIGWFDTNLFRANFTFMFPKPNGVPTHIRTNWEMSDFGHQAFSTWHMSILVPTFGLIADHQVRSPINVKATLHKGVVPLEPGHRDFWQGKSELTALDSATLYIGCRGNNQPVNCVSAPSYPDLNVGWTPTHIIPPGTERVKVVLEQERVSEPEPYNWGLQIRRGDDWPGTGLGAFEEATPTTEETLRKEYDLTLSAQEADPFYARRSNWRFLLDDHASGSPVVTNGPIGFTLTVTAYAAKSTTSAADMIRLPIPEGLLR